MTRSGLPRIALLALIWGSAFLWIKLADRGFSPVEVTLARLVLGAAVLSAVIETITATVLAGIALVLAGVALTRRRTKPATDEPSVG
jgi:drug/metabolite transporter (DMT)-like permease